jgi:ribosomal protein S27E|tara:strand:+ start:6620 stop:6874 length:255 start_codon:yes stop_codon:yes gene_type:complete
MPEFKKHSFPLPDSMQNCTQIMMGSGDTANIDCPECDSKNVIFEEYIRPMTADEADLGIKCEGCGYKEDPDEYGERFEPTEPED